MLFDDEDGDQSLDLEQVLGAAAADPRAQQLLQLLMRSQDLGSDGGGAVESGSESESDSDGDGSGDSAPIVVREIADDAPVAADVELDLTTRQQPPDSPPSTVPPQIRTFCAEHGVDPAALPAPGSPTVDAGVTFESLLVGEMNPVSVNELQLVSHTTEVDPAEGRRTLGVRNLTLCGRLVSHGEPVQYDDEFAVRLHIADAAEDDMRVLLLDGSLATLPPEELAREVLLRFPAGTTVAASGFDLIVLPSSFICILNVAGDPDAQLHRLGRAALPPLRLSQVDRTCSLLRKAGMNARMVKVTVDAMAEAAGEVDALLRPLLVSLALAHLRLGSDGTALAYAVAAMMVVFQKGPPEAACVAAQVLNKMGLANGACSALYLGKFPSGHELEPVEMIGHQGLKGVAGLEEGRPNVDAEENLARAVRSGMTQIAEGLSRTEREWLDHGLGDVEAVRVAAERAAARHGAGAASKLRQEADALYAAGAAGPGPPRYRAKVEEAVLKWRAALWLMLDPEGLEGRAGYHAWSVMNTRYQHWDEAQGTLEPKALHYMDLAALAVLRDCHVNVSVLRGNVYKGRCKLGDWEAVLTDALDACLSKIAINA